MQLAMVIGHATSTIKHRSFAGAKLMLVQPLGNDLAADGDCCIAVDKLGADVGQTVIIDSDGHGARKMIGDNQSPVRWFVVGIRDE